MSFPYIHDFGSILRFIELNFGVGQIAPAPFISEYADINAPAEAILGPDGGDSD